MSNRRIHLRAQLDTAAYPVDLAETQAEGLVCIAKAAPDVVIIADDLPGLRLRQFCKLLRGKPQTQFTKVVVAVQSENQSARVSALVDGAHDVIDVTTDPADLKARVRNFMKSSAGPDLTHAPRPSNTPRAIQPHRGLAEAQTPFGTKTIASVVASSGSALAGSAFSDTLDRIAQEALIDIRTPPIPAALRNPDGQSDVFVLHETAPEDGIRDALIALRHHPVSKNCAILFVSDCPSPGASVLDLGADDQVPTAISASELTLRIERLARRKRDADRKRQETTELAQKAYIDRLTGLNNRTAMEEYLTSLDRALADRPKSVALMIADLDHFKAINDNHGHAAGDMILAHVAQTLTSKLREGDFIARYGGEEFLIVLPNITQTHALAVAERLRNAVANSPTALDGATHVRATLSIGLAMAHRSTRTSTTNLQRAADNALYAAKRQGRNRIELASFNSPYGQPIVRA